MALPRRAPGPHHAALDAAAAVLPVVGRGRACARMAGARGRPARGRGRPEPPGAGRTVGAQGRVEHRARGAAGGGRLAEPEYTVSARAAALKPAPPMRRRSSGGSSARALDVHDWVHVCVRMCVRSSACMRVRTYARMRRMHSSVRVRVCARVCARDVDLHLGILVHMCIIICTRACMYTCVRALVEWIAACVGVRVRGRGRGLRERASTNCVSLRTLHRCIFNTNVGMYVCILVCLYICVCV